MKILFDNQYKLVNMNIRRVQSVRLESKPRIFKLKVIRRRIKRNVNLRRSTVGNQYRQIRVIMKTRVVRNRMQVTVIFYIVVAALMFRKNQKSQHYEVDLLTTRKQNLK